MLAKCVAVLVGRNQAQNAELEAFAELAGFGQIISAVSPDNAPVSWPIRFYLYHEGLGDDLLGPLVHAQRADGVSRLWPAILLFKDVTAPQHPHIGGLGFDAVLPLSGDADMIRQRLGALLQARLV